MAVCKHYLPGFKGTCLTIGLLNVMLAGSLFLRGLGASMAEFRVPAATVASAHYLDALTWVYVHMIVVGVLIGALGLWVDAPLTRRRFARVLLAAHLVYACLDFRSSDSVLGNGLYQGSASLLPGLYCLVACLLFLHLSFCWSAVSPAAALERAAEVAA